MGQGDGSTTFTLPDLRGAFLRGTGVHGTGSPANESYSFEGPEVGKFQNDMVQGFGLKGWSSYYGDVVVAAHWNRNDGVSPGQSYQSKDDSPVNAIMSDGDHGVPRIGPETRPFNAGVNYIIKI